MSRPSIMFRRPDEAFFVRRSVEPPLRFKTRMGIPTAVTVQLHYNGVAENVRYVPVAIDGDEVHGGCRDDLPK